MEIFVVVSVATISAIVTSIAYILGYNTGFKAGGEYVLEKAKELIRK